MSTINHIGFIMDGNRRFAKRLMLEPWKGHEYGKNKFRQVLEWVRDYNIKEATFYTFSLENFARPQKEFDYLMKLFAEVFDEIIQSKELEENQTRIRFIGRVQKFPQNIQDSIAKLEENTKTFGKYLLNIAFGYGGRDEITSSVQHIAQKVKEGSLTPEDITDDTIKQHLSVQSEPDLIIRTGGDHRTSNFLPWQSVYSEWFFLEKKWPELEKTDVDSCIAEFESRERRFGK